MNPPLRTAEDVAVLGQAVRDGTIDVFATDHAPHGLDEKAQLLSEAPVGFKNIRLRFDLDGDATPDEVASLQKLTERYCVVYQTLISGIKPEVDFHVEPPHP